MSSAITILYYITGRTPDLQCIFGNHLKPGLSRPVGQVCRSNTILYKCLLSKAEKKLGYLDKLRLSEAVGASAFRSSPKIYFFLIFSTSCLISSLSSFSSPPPGRRGRSPCICTVAYTPPNHQNYEQDQRKYLDLVQSTIIS